MGAFILRSSVVSNPETLAHGDLFTITGSGFGTRGDYNLDDYTFMGERHIHALFGYFDQDMPADGSSQATFEAALYGMFPATGFSFVNNPSSRRLTFQSGGPSQSGRFLRKISESFAEGGYLMIQTPDSTSIPEDSNGYISYKHRGSGGGKIMRWWQNGTGSSGQNWYVGATALVTEGGGSPTGWYDNWTRSTTTFEHHELFMRQGDASMMFVDGMQILFTSNENETFNLLTSPPDSSRDLLMSWPNSVDSGGQYDTADIYVDWTEARVMCVQGGVSEVQPVKSWADGAVQIIFNKGELSAGAATLSVYDASSAVLASQEITVA